MRRRLVAFVSATAATAAALSLGPLTTAGADVGLVVEPVLSGLSIPWDVAVAPDGTVLTGERAGGFVVRRPDGSVVRPSADLSTRVATGETGLMGLAIDPGFTSNRRLYSCQGHGTGGQLQDIRVVVWQAAANWSSLARVADLLVGIPADPVSQGRHGGCRLRIAADGAMLVGTGDRAYGFAPQDLTSLAGKVLRIDRTTGQPAPGNPFVGAADPRTRMIYTYGHRNVQGLALRANGQAWSVEHGPDRDDEVNLLVAGADYGWNPVGTTPPQFYNENVPMTRAGATPARWSSGAPTVATSGADFLRGSAWGEWDGALAVATLRGSALRLQRYSPAGALEAEVLPSALNGTYGRLRSVTTAPDGSLYVTTSNGSGDRVLRVRPAGASLEPYVRALYLDLLGRPADPGGLAAWLHALDRGQTSAAGVAVSFTRSTEYTNRRVDSLYRRVLGRGADPGGASGWGAVMRSDPTGDRTVLVVISASDEAWARAGGTAGGYVIAMYRAWLGRGAGSSEVAYWAPIAARDRVATAAGIALSAEATSQRVAALYTVMLGRAPDPGGLAHHQVIMASAGDTAATLSLVTSAEYRARAAAR